jgi:hypothetical protein
MTAERLLSAREKTQAKLEAKTIDKLKQEQATLLPTPGMSAGSKRLMQTRSYVPIYSPERLQQLAAHKKEKIEKLKQELNARKQEREEKEANAPIHFRGEDVTKVELCFDPTKVQPMIYQEKQDTGSDKKATTEEREVRKRCSFHPNTDKKSTEMFAKV